MGLFPVSLSTISTVKIAASLRAFLAVLSLLLSASADANDIGYDPSADPFQQLAESVEQARQQGKYVLVISGGEWCKWCYVLEEYLQSNQTIADRLQGVFVIMKVYWGEKNFNERFFNKLPTSAVAPHFWVINENREVLLSQNASVFEQGRKGYSDDVFNTFIRAIEDHQAKRRAKNGDG